MEDFIVYSKRSRMAFLSLISLKFSVLGVVFIFSYFAESRVPIFIPIIGGLIILLSIYISIKLFIRIFNPKIILIVSDDGITEPSIGFIPWEEIAKIDVVSFAQQEFIGIFPHQEKSFADHEKDSFMRRSLKGAHPVFHTQVLIAVADIDCSIDKLLAEMNKRWDQSTKSCNEN